MPLTYLSTTFEDAWGTRQEVTVGDVATYFNQTFRTFRKFRVTGITRPGDTAYVRGVDCDRPVIQMAGPLGVVDFVPDISFEASALGLLFGQIRLEPKSSTKGPEE